MNIRKYHDEDYLKELVFNKKELNDIITESKGYVLHVMEKKKIFPSLDFLIDDNNPYKLLFIIKNYELNREQIKEIRKFFSSSASNKVANDILNQEEIEQYLKEKTLLPSSTILSLEILHKYPLEINEQFQINDYHTNNIINNSVKLLELHEFLSIDENILKWNLNAFNAIPHFFTNKDFKEKYIKMLFDKEAEHFVRWHNFRNFHFFEEDLSLLKNILTYDEDSKLPYKEAVALKGVSKLISKLEYFKEYNSKNISDFTNEELKLYKTEIQNTILEKIPSRHYELANYLLNITASQEQFEYIIDEDFLINFISKVPMLSLDNHDRESEEYKKKSLYFTKLGFKLIIKNLDNEDIINKLSFHDIVKGINRLVEKDTFSIDANLSNDITTFYNTILPKLLLTENFSELLRYYDYFINKNSINSLEFIANNNPTINLLTVLLSYEQKNRKNKTRYSADSEVDGKVVKIINSLISKLDRESVKKVTSYYDYSIPLLTMVGNISIDKYKTNFLNINVLDLENVSEENINLVLEVDESFKKKVIEKKIVLPIEIVKNLLSRSLKLSKNLKFIINYVKINKVQFLENESLLSALIQEPLTKDLIKIDTQSMQIDSYKKLLNNYKKEQELNLLMKDFHRKGDYESEGYKELENKNSNINTENVMLKNMFTFDFMKEKIQELISNKNFEEFVILKNYSLTHAHHDIFYNYVNSSHFDNVLKDLENLSYRELIKSTLSMYGGDTQNNIQFSKFNQTQNSILAGMLLPLLDSDSESNSQSEKIFQLFPYSKRNFLNEFIVKNMPLKMFYSYDLIPNIKNEKCVLNQVYTNKQIIEAFNSVEKSSNFFSYNDNRNISCAGFFRDNFAKNEKGYLELLEFAKNNNPKLYVILGNKEIFGDFLKRNENKNNDELISDYSLANFETEDLLKGFKQIFQEIKDSKSNYIAEQNYNSGFALACIRSVIHNTYYDKDINYVRTHLSPYSTEDSEKMVELFFNEAPLFLMNSWMVGNIHPIADHININFGKYIKTDNIIDTLLVPSAQISESNFSISNSDDKEDYRAQGYLGGMIKHYLQEEKEIELDYISFLIERDTFFQDEISSDDKRGHALYSQTLDFLKNNKEIKNKLNISQSKFSLDNMLSEKKEVKAIFKRKKI